MKVSYLQDLVVGLSYFLRKLLQICYTLLMNITKGTLICRGKRGMQTWSWKYQVDGHTRWEALNLPPGGSKREAEILRDVKLTSYRNDAGASVLSTLTVDELISKYLEYVRDYYVKPNGRPTTEGDLVSSALAPLKKRFGKIKASEFGPLKLKTLREDMIELKWKRGTINSQVSRVRRMFKWAVENELVPVSVFQSLQAVSGLKRGRSQARESSKVKPVLQKHVDAIEPFVSRQVWAMIQLQLLTGARGGEICLLRPVDFDTVGKVWIAQPKEHKTEHHEKERIVFFGPRAQEIVKDFLIDRPVDSYLFSPAEAASEKGTDADTHRRENQKPTRRRTIRKVGECYTIDSYRRAVTRACNEAEVPKWTPHQLRHNAGTNVRREFGLDAAQVILGHSKASTTELYAEADKHKAREIMMKIG